jgi:RNase P subunit RPR2
MNIEQAASLVRTCPECYGPMVPYAIETDGSIHNVDFMCKTCGLGKEEFHYTYMGPRDGNA